MNDGSWWTDRPIQNMNKCLPQPHQKTKVDCISAAQKSFPGEFIWIRLKRGRKLDCWSLDTEALQTVPSSENRAKKLQIKQKWEFSTRNDEFVFPCKSGEVLQVDQPLSTAIYMAWGNTTLEFQEVSSEEKDEARDPDPDGEARQDFWSILGNYICRNHVAPRTRLYAPKDDFLMLLHCIDVQRQAKNEHWCTSWGYHRWLAEHLKDKARIFVFVEAFHKALPQKSGRRQRNDSTDDSSCSSLECTPAHWRIFKGVMDTLQNHKKSQESQRLFGLRQKIEFRNNRGAQPRGWAAPHAHVRRRILAIRRGEHLTEWRLRHGLPSSFRTEERITEAGTTSYYTIKEEAAIPSRPKNTLNTNKLYSGKGKTWPNKPQNPTLHSGHRRLHGQTWRQSEWPTTFDVSATRLDHKRNNPSSGRLLRNDSVCLTYVIFLNSFFELTVGEWLSHALFQSSFTQTHMWRTPHIKKLS